MMYQIICDSLQFCCIIQSYILILTYMASTKKPTKTHHKAKKELNDDKWSACICTLECSLCFSHTLCRVAIKSNLELSFFRIFQKHLPLYHLTHCFIAVSHILLHWAQKLLLTIYCTQYKKHFYFYLVVLSEFCEPLFKLNTCIKKASIFRVLCVTNFKV